MNLSKVGERISIVSFVVLGTGVYIGAGALVYHVATAPVAGSVIGAIIVGCISFGLLGAITSLAVSSVYSSTEQPQQKRSYCECNDEGYWSDTR